MSYSQKTTVEHRVFNIVLFLTFIFCCLTTLTNIIFRLPLLHVIQTTTGGVLCGYMLYRSLTEINFEPISVTFSYFVLFMLLTAWFSDNGTRGSTGYLFMFMTVAATIYLTERHKLYFLITTLAVFAGLFFVEGLAPYLLTNSHASSSQLLYDVACGIIFSVLFVWYAVRLVLEQHRNDRQKLSKSIEEIKTLREILPICSSCKKIRDDKGYWSQLEKYFGEHAHLEFTHGLCPDCLREVYAQGNENNGNNNLKDSIEISTSYSDYLSSMNTILAKVMSRLFGNALDTTVENRIFNAITFQIFLMGCICTLSNILLKLPIYHVLLTFVIAMVGLAVYLRSISTKRYEALVVPFTIFNVSLLVFLWFIDNGTLGSVSYFMITATVMAAMYLRGKSATVFITTLIASIVILVFIESSYPAFLHNAHSSNIQRLIDVSMCFMLCVVIIIFSVHVVIKQYRDDRHRLSLALSEIQTLRGILPICSSCKKIRDDKGYWNQIEKYFNEHTDYNLSSGLCPECASKQK